MPSRRGRIKSISGDIGVAIDIESRREIHFKRDEYQGLPFDSLRVGMFVRVWTDGRIATRIRGLHPELSVEHDLSFPPLTVFVDRGNASSQEIAEVLFELSTLYRMIGGSGITFRCTEVKEPRTA